MCCGFLFLSVACILTSPRLQAMIFSDVSAGYSFGVGARLGGNDVDGQ